MARRGASALTRPTRRASSTERKAATPARHRGQVRVADSVVAAPSEWIDDDDGHGLGRPAIRYRAGQRERATLQATATGRHRRFESHRRATVRWRLPTATASTRTRAVRHERAIRSPAWSIRSEARVPRTPRSVPQPVDFVGLYAWFDTRQGHHTGSGGGKRSRLGAGRPASRARRRTRCGVGARFSGARAGGGSRIASLRRDPEPQAKTAPGRTITTENRKVTRDVRRR